MTEPTGENQRVIICKGETIIIPPGAVGQPVADFIRPVPASLAGALVYEIGGRRIIAKQGDAP